ncbi:Uncharacterised protein [Legionella wadsworthii]|uniref:Uncharacterized protein n=1 Tax=Legionella wadsworthii TaxID=28088 RepID=A0A378LS75_9GAMM|nr:hypothetical protein [Legionella wadsworthii]STY29815.1 Uncharacterised protein [Legionella wadsworthii]
MPQITGRDIYSIKEWQTILDGSKYDKENTIIEQISEAITKYHHLEKKEADNIFDRKALLIQIERLCDHYITERRENLISKSKGEVKKLEGSVDYWILSLKKKANSKLHYLNKLEEFLTNAKPHHIQRKEMIEHLKVRNQTNTPSRLKLFSGTYLEKIDPVHRQFEFNMNHLPNKKSGLNAAFLDWIKSEDPTPFFLWLESHEVLTQNTVIDKKHKIKLIDYEVQTAHIVTFKSLDGQNFLVSKQKNSDAEAEPLNSRLMKNYTFKMGSAFGSTAFVWSMDNENDFITHPHQEGKFHHSSLSSGKSVRCAGMWAVSNGIVTHISNSSGHYRPSSLSFYLLIKFLESKGVINSNTKVADLRKENEAIDPSKPFGGKKSPYISLEEYLSWAEELPEVQEYLNNIKKPEDTSTSCIIL